MIFLPWNDRWNHGKSEAISETKSGLLESCQRTYHFRSLLGCLFDVYGFFCCIKHHKTSSWSPKQDMYGGDGWCLMA